MTVRLAILIATRPGLGHRQEEAFKRLAPVVRAEDGCLQYDLHRVEGDADQFLLLEHWASQASLGAHDVAAHMVEQDAVNGEFRAGPALVLRLEPHPIS